jgi:cardiolipin synthase
VDGSGAEVPTPSARVLTVPNLISAVRLACIPWFGWLVWGADDLYGAAVLLAILGATDWIDGYIARHFHQVSAVGKFIDPAADRLLLVVAAVAVITTDAVPWWFAVAAMAREVLVIAGGIVLALRGIRGLEVEYIGKVGAFGLMFSFPFFLAAASDVSWGDTAYVLAWICGIPGLVFSWFSASHYFVRARAVLAGRNRHDATEDGSLGSDETSRSGR